MKVTAVEWLEENMPNISKHISLGVAIEFTAKFQQAKQKEKELCQKIWDSAQYDMRKQMRSSAYKGMTFEEWFEQSSKIDNV